MDTGRGSRRTAVVGGAMLAAGAYAWAATALRPFTLPALAAVLGGGLAAMAGGRLLGRNVRFRFRLPGPPVLWAALLAALGVWEARAFARHPRSEHPTISSLANGLFASHPARALALWVWLVGAAGAGLLRRSRGRLPVLAAWLWLGWHLFVRAGYG